VAGPNGAFVWPLAVLLAIGAALFAVTGPLGAGATPEGSPGGSASDGPARTPGQNGWELLISEDFDRPAALGRFASVYPGWASYDGGIDTSRNFGRHSSTQGVYDSARTMSVSDGILDLHVHTSDGRPRVGAVTPTPDGKYWSGQMYGRYEVRFRADRVPGYKIAWLLWPSSDDWPEGEIDFPEGDLGGDITGSSHDTTGDPSRNAWYVDTETSMDDWHTAVIEWTPGKVAFELDGRTWSSRDPAALPRHPMRWALQAETGLSPQAPDPSAAGHISIDYVRAYRLR
jgi:hypothetical protein